MGDCVEDVTCCWALGCFGMRGVHYSVNMLLAWTPICLMVFG